MRVFGGIVIDEKKLDEIAKHFSSKAWSESLGRDVSVNGSEDFKSGYRQAFADQGEKIKRLEKAVELMRSSAKISIDYSAENCDCGSEGNPELRYDHFCDCCANSYAFQDILAEVDAILKGEQ